MPHGASQKTRRCKPFQFKGLEAIPRSRIELLSRLEWLLPEGLTEQTGGEVLKGRLNKLFDEEVYNSDEAFLTDPVIQTIREKH